MKPTPVVYYIACFPKFDYREVHVILSMPFNSRQEAWNAMRPHLNECNDVDWTTLSTTEMDEHRVRCSETEQWCSDKGGTVGVTFYFNSDRACRPSNLQQGVK